MENSGWLTKKDKIPRTISKAQPTSKIVLSTSKVHPLDRPVLFQQKITKFVCAKPKAVSEISKAKSDFAEVSSKPLASGIKSENKQCTKTLVISKTASEIANPGEKTAKNMNQRKSERGKLESSDGNFTNHYGQAKEGSKHIIQNGIIKDTSDLKDNNNVSIFPKIPFLAPQQQLHQCQLLQNDAMKNDSRGTDDKYKIKEENYSGFFGMNSFDPSLHETETGSPLKSSAEQSDTEFQLSFHTQTSDRFIPFVPLPCDSQFALESENVCKYSETVKPQQNDLNFKFPSNVNSEIKEGLDSPVKHLKHEKEENENPFEKDESLNLDLSMHPAVPVKYREMFSEFTLTSHDF